MRITILLLSLLGSATVNAQTDRPALKLAPRPPGYFASHNDRVQHAFLRFASVHTPERAANRLEILRERDRLQLFHGVVTNDSRVGYGVAVFGAMTILSAHAPRALRVVFEGPVHLGPAFFDHGGMGAGIGGRFL